MIKYNITNPSRSDNAKGLKILAVGSPLIDAMVQVDDKFLEEHVAGEKGGMLMVDNEYQKNLLEKISSDAIMMPGGSAANTIFLLAELGLNCSMFGKIGDDESGHFYCNEFAKIGGETKNFRMTSEAPTGVCLAAITPDAERTMRTNLGASVLINQEDVNSVDFAQYDLVYIEGYMLYAPIFDLLLEKAKLANCKIGLDLAAFEVVRDFKDKLPNILEKYVDVVLANKDEAKALFPELSANEALDELAKYSQIAVVKLGSSGSIIKSGSEQVEVPAVRTMAIDTTAAGDYFAAGFLYGLSSNWSLEKSGSLGSLTASEIIKVIGPKMSKERIDYIKEKISSM